MSRLASLLSVLEFPDDVLAELNERCDQQRAESIEHMEAHGCKLHLIDCEVCQERVWPEGSAPGGESMNARAVGYQLWRTRGYGLRHQDDQNPDLLCIDCLRGHGVDPNDPVCPWSLLRPEELSEGPVHCHDCGVLLIATYRDGSTT